MSLRVSGEEDYDPRTFERARQLVWHYGHYSITNPDHHVLKEIWETEHPEPISSQDRSSFRALVLAGRSLTVDDHVCDETCAELPIRGVSD